jgi:hypothetical protein
MNILVAGFGISSIELSGSATTVRDKFTDDHSIKFNYNPFMKFADPCIIV